VSAECHMQAFYAKCHYAECRYAKCHYSECNGPFIRVNL
jgi:hypothetical protein